MDKNYIDGIDTRVWNQICNMQDNKISSGMAHERIMKIIFEVIEKNKILKDAIDFLE